METAFKSRKQVSFDQLKALIDFLKEHPELAKGLVRGRRGKLHTLKLWNLCAKKLNVIKDGATKDGKGWSKYWCDWKYRVRRRTLELKAAQDSNRPPPDGVTALSPLEEDILTIIGETSVEGVMIKCDPLAGGDTDEEPENNDVSASVKVPYTQTTRSRKRRHSSLEGLTVEEGDNNRSPVRKPKIKHGDDYDTDLDDEFLRLEREKIDIYKSISESIQTLTSEIKRLTDVFVTHIRDNFTNGRANL